MKLLASLILLFSIWAGSVDSKNTISVNFVITNNESASDIANKLLNQKLIKSAQAAKIYLRLLGLDQKIQAGSYLISPSQDLKSVVETLIQKPKDIWVTIPEGWRREQIAKRLDKPDFVAKTATLEGKLFPDTYLLPTYVTTDEIIQIMADNFQQKVGQIDKNTLILASLIERETKFTQDRPVVAGILAKRLENNWPLQIDATVQYAKGDWQPLTDTKYPSLYNTYIHTGLPPGPICNPGLSAINAARHPQDSPYWFYLNTPDGKTYFAKTLEEHNLNIDKYLKN